MFIELTDHLRCPNDHAERFLVLLPTRMEERRVITGELGCPACGAVVQLEQGIADWGTGVPSDGRTSLTAPAIAAFLGLSGPGGYVALVGGPASLALALAPLLAGIRLVLVNPFPGTADTAEASVLRAGRLPLKAGSMRGAVLGADLWVDPEWLTHSAAAVLPGLRVVAEGIAPPAEGVEVLARTPECWVGRRI